MELIIRYYFSQRLIICPDYLKIIINNKEISTYTGLSHIVGKQFVGNPPIPFNPVDPQVPGLHLALSLPLY